jgi:hypothetical protein
MKGTLLGNEVHFHRYLDFFMTDLPYTLYRRIDMHALCVSVSAVAIDQRMPLHLDN